MAGLRARRPSRERRAPAVLMLLIALYAACAGPAPSSPPAEASPADTLRIGLISPGFKFFMVRTADGGFVDLHTVHDSQGPTGFPLSNGIVKGIDIETALIGRFLFRSLYRLDEHLLPVPDLAAHYCRVDASLTRYDCPLRPARFSNGDRVTAEDVAFTYELARSPLNPFDANSYDFGAETNWLVNRLVGVKVIDTDTVEFTLAEPDPTFATTVLPEVSIVPKRQIERQYDSFRSTAVPIGADKLNAEAELLEAALGDPDADCVAAMQGGKTMLAAAGVELPDEAYFSYGPGGSFESCIYAQRVVATDLRNAASSLSKDGLDAIAAAYPLLPHRLRPVGTGSWALDEKTSVPGRRILLVASPNADQEPATRRIDFQIFPSRRDAVAAFAAGRLDWLPVPSKNDETQGGATIYRELRDLPNVEFAEHGEGGIEGLYFNMRPGRLFGDVKLRRALEVCIDKPAIVDATTDGQGVRAYGTLGDGQWAANPDLPKIERNVEAGRTLIEAAGWRLNSGGIYAKGDLRLSADLWAGNGEPERDRFAQLVALQARECGFDLTVKTADDLVQGNDKRLGVIAWPHVAPDGKPVEAWLMGPYDTAPIVEPSPNEDIFDSHFPTSEQAPNNLNFSGYNNTEVDKLLATARATDDFADRAVLYRREQAIVARDLPVIPGWQRLVRDALRSGVSSVDGPLDLRAPNWSSQLEHIVVPATN